MSPVFHSDCFRSLLVVPPVLLLVSALAAAAPKAAVKPAPRYALTDLGPLPAVADEVSLPINDSGQVAGWATSDGQSVHAVLWTEGKPRDLGVPKGFRSSLAHGLNDKGEAVGWAGANRVLVDSAAVTHACLFAGGQVTDLGTLGGRDSKAFGINDAGRIVGVSDRADGTRHAFLFEKGHMADLGGLPGGKFSMAYAVNAKGSIAGVAEAAGHRLHGVLWVRGKISDLGALPGGGASLAYALNASGQAVGSAETGNEYHATRDTELADGTRPSAVNTLQDLGTLGADPAAAFGINDQGQIVGGSSLSTIVHHAFLWENGRMSDLNSLMPPHSGWTLISATGINHAAQIACLARQKTGPLHAVRLDPLPR